MTLKDFDEILDLKSEISVLAKRLTKEKSPGFVGDYAKDYSTGEARIITISGYPLPNSEKIDEISALLVQRKDELEERILKAEQFINSLTDSRLRTLLTLKYMGSEDMTWDEVAKNVYRKMSGDAARKTVSRYFEEISKLE